MQTKSDAQLLREYAEYGAEAAFTEIVNRHTNLVYSAALRQLDSPDIAAEVAQSVFVGLAHGAQSLSRRLAGDASLAGWLCRSARNVSLNHRRDEFRRHAREKMAMEDLTTLSETAPDWDRLRSVLDATMSELDEADYDALVMRFFRNQDLRSVGKALGVSDDTAQKRVSRALDKLREHLTRRGITTTAAALSVALSANAIQPAPAGLAAAISAAAALVRTAATSSTAIAVTKTIAMTTLQKTLITTAFAAVLGTGIYEAHRAANLQGQTASLKTDRDSLNDQLQKERADASNRLAVVQHQNTPATGDLSEVLKLRAQVAKLKDEMARMKSAAAPETAQDGTAAEVKSWLDRVKKLKAKLTEAPNWRVPEFQLLTDQDWLDAVKDLKQLDTDADFSKAFSGLRNAATREVEGDFQGALHAYIQANNGALPTDFSQLQQYFATPLGDDVLQGYQFNKAGQIASQTDSLIDPNGDYFAQHITIDKDGISSSTTSEDALHQAIQAFLGANSGQTLTDPAQLLPYVTTPEEKTALQKILQQNNGH